jgi:AcrR family transcriptional regulator
MAYRKTQNVQEVLADKRVRILQAARKLVSRGGFRETGVDAVAAEAGVATGTLYRYFPSKAALFVEVVSRVSEREVGIIAAIARQPEKPSKLLPQAVQTFARRALANRRLAYALIVEPSDPEVEAVRLLYRRKLADGFAAIIAAGIAAAEFADQDASVSGTCIVGALMESLIGPLAREDDAPAPLIAAIESFCVAAVRPRV